ncbi:oxygenase MpaB family protein [Curtobacterium sp. MCPF17_050]|uniref:oxygenase MpaB family protein n=1 Tax=Curtobacterium sp. MCPF17_050 TaxID=2175664 RepID=UPI000D8E8D58|nr:oxygenase MpaB family protein [Curtobacterium sp. MCPF17_050]WIB15246.1 oxygenase MpaB family protein [Curtobacterium sp. MCPF17_050]
MTGRRTGGPEHDVRGRSRPSPGHDRDRDRPGHRDRALRRFIADSTPVIAGGRAILLQIADPVVAAGVRRHSDFAERPQQRLAHTLMYVYAVVTGTARDAAVARSFVEHAHRPVAGANEVDRQLWVAATLYDSAIRTHRLLGTPVDAERAEAVLRAYAPIATALRVPADRWPTSVAAFEAYWADTLGTLRVTDDARSVVRDLLHPRAAPLWVRSAMPLVRIVTVGMLPDAVRDDYGFAWGPREERRWRRTLAGIRAARAVVPGPLLRLPRVLLLRGMHRTAARHAHH